MTPPPDPAPVATDDQRRRNRRTLLLLLAVFFVPMLVAGILRFADVYPAATKRRGEMLEPIVDLRTATPALHDGTPYAWKPAERTWRVLVAPPADCGDECGQTVKSLYTVWEVLGQDADRVDILWLCPQAGCTPPADAPLPHLRLLRPDAALRAKLPRVDQVAYAKGPAKARGVPVYVIDPNGFVILRYAAGSDPGDLRYDLSKLLKLK